MKYAFLALLSTLVTSPAFATLYNCEVTDVSGDKGGATSKELVQFSLDTDKDENKFFSIGNGLQAGCVVFKAQVNLINCAIGGENAPTATGSAEIGSVLLAVQLNNGAKAINLGCNRR